MALAVLLAWPAASASAQDLEAAQLTICMQQNDPPLSARATDTGFDLALARVIASQLGRDLRIQWFISRDDPDASLAHDANALLSDGRCQLLAEYPLTKNTLAPPRSPSARLPPFDGAKADDRRRWIQIGKLTPTRPYRLDTLTVVLSPRSAGHDVHILADLDGLKLGVRLATLSDAIAMRYRDGRLQDNVVHIRDATELFSRLQDNLLDAGLVDLRAFDAWRLRHSSTPVVTSGYRHSLAFNIGYVGLAENTPLIRQVNHVLTELQASNAIAPLGTSTGLTFIPPREPDILPDLQLAALNGD